MRLIPTTLAATFLWAVCTAGSAAVDNIEALWCSDLKQKMDGALSVTCEISNETSMQVSSFKARVEYLAAEELGPIASHVVDAFPYDPEGIPPHGQSPVPFSHPQLPSAYMEFPHPIIRVEILEARDRSGQTIFRRAASPDSSPQGI